MIYLLCFFFSRACWSRHLIFLFLLFARLLVSSDVIFSLVAWLYSFVLNALCDSCILFIQHLVKALGRADALNASDRISRNQLNLASVLKVMTSRLWRAIFLFIFSSSICFRADSATGQCCGEEGKKVFLIDQYSSSTM